jgi:hypothetical protein
MDDTKQSLGQFVDESVPNDRMLQPNYDLKEELCCHLETLAHKSNVKKSPLQ